MAGPRGRTAGGGDVALGGGLVVRDGELVLLGDASPAADPGLVLRVAARATYDGLPIAAATLARLGAEAPVLDGPWTDEQRDALVALLDAGDNTVGIFETLDQHDLVTRILPEWQPVRSRPQRNAFHRYTIDRHLVESRGPRLPPDPARVPPRPAPGRRLAARPGQGHPG